MRKKKDVLFLCQYFYPEYVSSATLPLDTAIAIEEAGYTVDVLCGYPKEYNLEKEVRKKEKYKRIRIKRLRYIQSGRKGILSRLINYFSFTFMVLLRFFSLRSYRVIIVYSNPPILPLIAAFSKMVFKTKVVFVSYDVYPEIAYKTNVISERSIISKLMQIVNKAVFKNVSKVVALSTEMKLFLIENRKYISAEDVVIISNWYENNKDITSELKEVSNKKLETITLNNKLVVSYFGNMGTAQDMTTLIDAIRILKEDKEIHFVFAGHGNKMNVLNEIVINEELKNVTVFRFLHNQDYQEALYISDCFIVTLAEGIEDLAVPSKTYGYMMAGKPIISIMNGESDITKDLTTNKAGYAFEIGESNKLVDSLIQLKDNEAIRLRMGKNCREVYLEKYTKDISTASYVKLLKELLEDENV